MGEDGGARRPSIATIFNPRRGRGSVPSRPSVVVTDEDSPGPPLQLSNGSGVRVGSAGLSGGGTPPVGSPSINLGSPLPPLELEAGKYSTLPFLPHTHLNTSTPATWTPTTARTQLLPVNLIPYNTGVCQQT